MFKINDLLLTKLLLPVILSLLFIPQSALSSQTNTVNVNATIGAAQMIETDLRDLDPSQRRIRAQFELLSPSKEEVEDGYVIRKGEFKVRLGSNKCWQLKSFVNLPESIGHSAGWKLERVLIRAGGERRTVKEKPSSVLRGEKGSFSLRIEYEIHLKFVQERGERSEWASGFELILAVE